MKFTFVYNILILIYFNIFKITFVECILTNFVIILREMFGPTIGGILLEEYGFAVLTTAMAYSTFIMVHYFAFTH